jgi:hypothetical protein
MSHLGIFFEDVDLTTLLLNNHINLNAQETFGNVKLVWFENNVYLKKN